MADGLFEFFLKISTFKAPLVQPDETGKGYHAVLGKLVYFDSAYLKRNSSHKLNR